MLSASQLSLMYRNKEMRPISVADIRLFSENWPASFRPLPLYSSQHLPTLDSDEYEATEIEEDDEDDNTNVTHYYMIVLQEESEITLLDCYDGFPYWKAAVTSGEMPPQWKIWTIKSESNLSLLSKIQLALFTSFRRLQIDHEDLKSISRSIDAFQVIVAAFQCHSSETSTTLEIPDLLLFERQKLMLNAVGDMFPEDSYLDMVCTAVAFSRNEGFARFLKEYEGDLCHVDAEVFNHADIFSHDFPFMQFTSLYWQRWWFRESLPAQLLLVFVLMKFYGYRVQLGDGSRKGLLRQFLSIIRDCADLVLLGYRRDRRFSDYSLLTLSFSSEEDAVDAPQGFPLQDTLLYHLGKSIAEIIYQSVQPLFDPATNLIPSKRRMPPNLYLSTHSACVSETTTTLTAKGILCSSEMAITAQLATA